MKMENGNVQEKIKQTVIPQSIKAVAKGKLLYTVIGVTSILLVAIAVLVSIKVLNSNKRKPNLINIPPGIDYTDLQPNQQKAIFDELGEKFPASLLPSGSLGQTFTIVHNIVFTQDNEEIPEDQNPGDGDEEADPFEPDEDVDEDDMFCNDSDGGKVYDIKGAVTHYRGSLNDYCLHQPTAPEGTLLEGYCLDSPDAMDNVHSSERYKCEFGCLDGECTGPVFDVDPNTFCQNIAQELDFSNYSSGDVDTYDKCLDYALLECGKEDKNLSQADFTPGILDALLANCCMWNCSEPQAGINCRAAYPKPEKPQDCYSRISCSKDQYCEFYPETLATPARCDCVTADMDADGISDDTGIDFEGYVSEGETSSEVQSQLQSIKNLVQQAYPELVSIMGKPSNPTSRRRLHFYYHKDANFVGFLPQYNAIVVNSSDSSQVLPALAAGFMGDSFANIPETWAYGIAYAAADKVAQNLDNTSLIGKYQQSFDQFNTPAYPISDTKIFYDKDKLGTPSSRILLSAAAFINANQQNPGFIADFNKIIYSSENLNKLEKQLNINLPEFKSWYKNQHVLHQTQIIPVSRMFKQIQNIFTKKTKEQIAKQVEEPEALKPQEQLSPPPKADFVKEGNIVSTCNLLYSAPGAPGISAKLSFRDYSQGDIQDELVCGHRVKIEGKTLEESFGFASKIAVIKLTSINKGSETEVCCTPSIETETQSTVPTDWQVYSHTNPTFSFKHPTDYKIDVSKNPTMSKLEFVTAYIGTDTFGATCSMGIKIWDNILTDDQDYAISKASQQSTVSIDGKTAQKYFTPSSSKVPRDVYNYYINDPQEGVYLSISTTENKGSSCLEVLNNMLSSFKFSN